MGGVASDVISQFFAEDTRADSGTLRRSTPAESTPEPAKEPVKEEKPSKKSKKDKEKDLDAAMK